MINPAPLSPLSKDYETLRAELLAKIPLITDGTWTNLNESDPGIAIVELLGSMLDNLYLYQDQAINELFLPTARQYLSIVRLLKLIGYETKGKIAAKGTVSISIDPKVSPVFPVIIPKYSVLSGGGLSYTTLEEGLLNSKNDQISLGVIQGSILSDNLSVFRSTGVAQQQFQLNSNDVDFASIDVYVTQEIDPALLVDDNKWERVTSFYQSNSTSKHYKVSLDSTNKIRIIFGDGEYGAVPPLNTIIKVIAFVTSGKAGNIDAGVISKFTSTIYDDTGVNAVNVFVNNALPIVGGADQETSTKAKDSALAHLTSQDRAMATPDFKGLIKALPSIDKAVAWGEQEEDYPNYAMMNRVQISFFSEEFITTNPLDLYKKFNAFRDTVVLPFLKNKVAATTRLVFIYPHLVDIYLKLNVAVDTSKYNPHVVTSEVKKKLEEYYAISAVDYGQDIRISDILRIVNQVAGVAWSRVVRLHTQPVPVGFKEVTSTNEYVIPVDTAPDPPQDIVLKKFEIPMFFAKNYDFNFNFNITTPYIKITEVPNVYDSGYVKQVSATNIEHGLRKVGYTNVRVINPDTQEDTFVQGLNILPDTTRPHIEITFTNIINEPRAGGGWYNKPAGDSATYTTV